jgi:hypothetical protein
VITRLCIVLLLLCFARASQAANAPLIYYGWDNPSISKLSDVLPKLANSPFDGMAVTATEHAALFTVKPLNEADFASDLLLLKQAAGKLSSSYLLIHAASDVDFDWSNDQHWNAVRQNLKSYAKLLKAGSFKGLVFDMEPYGKSPWSYGSQIAAEKTSFIDLSKRARKRGADMLATLQMEVPAIEIWSLYGLSANQDSDAIDLQNDTYGLWPAFFNGWIDAAASNTIIIDGNEPSYYYTKRQDFLAAPAHISSDLKNLLAPESQEKYQSTIRVGQAIYVDGIMASAKSPRFIGYYFQSKKARLNFLKSNIQNALQSTQSLVWVYTEIPKWWEAEPDKILDAAIRQAKQDAYKNIVRPDTKETAAAALALSQRISIGGRISDKNGKGVKVTGFKPELANVACSTWGDDGAFGCDFPKGIKIVIEPILENREITPKRAVRTNQNKSDWGVNFTVQ